MKSEFVVILTNNSKFKDELTYLVKHIKAFEDMSNSSKMIYRLENILKHFIGNFYRASVESQERDRKKDYLVRKLMESRQTDFKYFDISKIFEEGGDDNEEEVTSNKSAFDDESLLGSDALFSDDSEQNNSQVEEDPTQDMDEMEKILYYLKKYQTDSKTKKKKKTSMEDTRIVKLENEDYLTFDDFLVNCIKIEDLDQKTVKKLLKVVDDETQMDEDDQKEALKNIIIKNKIQIHLEPEKEEETAEKGRGKKTPNIFDNPQENKHFNTANQYNTINGRLYLLFKL